MAVLPECSRTTSSAADLVDLVAAAVAGDQLAWATLHSRFAQLISGVCQRYRLTTVDADDVSQTVWLRMVEHLKELRDARALPGWIVTTTKNEALRTLRARQRTEVADHTTDNRFQQGESFEPESRLHGIERERAVSAGLNELRPQQRDLMLLLASDEVSYEEISRRLHIPTGSIGPTRLRCLRKLRASLSIQELMV